MSRIPIEEINRRLRHSSLQYTETWCCNNHVEIHLCEITGQRFIYPCQYEAAITKKKFLALKKIYGEKIWEQEWKNAMQEQMKQNIAPIILN